MTTRCTETIDGAQCVLDADHVGYYNSPYLDETDMSLYPHQASTAATRELEAAIARLREHGWIPDLLVDHDAPVCETCGEGMEKHTESSAFVDDSYHQVDALTAQLEAATAKAALADEAAYYFRHGGVLSGWLDRYAALSAVSPLPTGRVAEAPADGAGDGLEAE